MATIIEQLEKEKLEAQKALEALATPAKTPEEVAAEEAEANRKANEEEAARAAAAKAEADKKALEAPPTGDVEALRAEVQRLTQQINDDNNPTWRQRYNSVKGTIDRQGEELKALRETVAQLQAQVKEPPKEEPKPVKMEDDPEYQALVEDIGEKAAKRQWGLEQAFARQTAELESLKGQIAGSGKDLETVKTKADRIEQSQAQTAGERFISSLSDSARKLTEPDEEGFIKDAAFVGYLNERIPETPYTRLQLYNAYVENMDAKGINEIAERYEQATGKKANPEPEKKPSRAEEYLEPSKTGSGVKEPTDKKEMIPESEYKAFQESIVRKTFKGTLAERIALQERFQTAGREGRILWGQ